MRYDDDFARMIAWLKENGLEGHTDRNGKTVFIVKRKPKPATKEENTDAPHES